MITRRSGNQWPARLALLLLLAIAIVATVRAFRNAQLPAYHNEKVIERSVEARPEASPISLGSADHELARLIDAAIENSKFNSARWGISVLSLHDGRVMYARNADQLFIPASNMKIYTTAVAL